MVMRPTRFRSWAAKIHAVFLRAARARLRARGRLSAVALRAAQQFHPAVAALAMFSMMKTISMMRMRMATAMRRIHQAGTALVDRATAAVASRDRVEDREAREDREDPVGGSGTNVESELCSETKSKVRPRNRVHSSIHPRS